MTPIGDDREECLRRTAAVQRLLAAEGFDALLVADDDLSRPPRGRTRYLSNFSAGLRPLAVVVPLRGEPTPHRAAGRPPVRAEVGGHPVLDPGHPLLPARGVAPPGI